MAERVLGQVAVEMNLKDQKFLKSLQNTTLAIRQTKSAMRANASEIALAGNAYQALATKQRDLTRVLEAQKNQLAVLNKEYQNSLTKTGEWQQSTIRYSTQINQAKNKINELSKALVDNARKMAEYRVTSMGVTGAVNKVGEASLKTGKTLRSVGSTMTAGVTTPIVMGFSYALNKVTAFDNRMIENKNLVRNAGESASEASENIKKMSRDAEIYSNRYGVSQQKIANGYQDLIKRGYTSRQALGAMNNELKASIATGDEFSDVTQVASQTIEAFGMRTNSTKGMMKATKTVLNELAYASDLTATNFKDTGVAMSYVSATAHQAGFSLASTAAAVGILSNNGLEADKAGTGLRKTILGLNSAVSKISNKNSVLAKLGVKKEELVGSNGQLRDLATCLDVVNKHTQGMKATEKAQVFQSLFGTTGRQAALILAENTKQMRSLTSEVEASTSKDYIGKLAKNNLKSAQNQIKIFKEQLTNAGMDAARIMLPYVTKALKSAENLLKAFNRLSSGQKQMIVDTVLATAALGPLASAFGAVFTAIGKVSAGSIKLFAKLNGWIAAKNTLKEISTVGTATGKTLTKVADVAEDAGKNVSKMGKDVSTAKESVNEMGEAASTAETSVGKMGATAGAAEKSVSEMETATDVAEKSVGEMGATAGTAEKTLTNVAEAAETAGVSVGEAGTAAGIAEEAIGATTTSVSGLTGALSLCNPAVLAAVAAVTGGVAVYELWGKKAMESAERTRKWGTDVDASTDKAATSFKNFHTDATLALNDTSSSAQKNIKDISKAFNGMTKTVEQSVAKQKKATKEWADSFGNAAVSKAVKEEADKENKALNKRVADIKECNAKVQAIMQRAKESHVALTDDERNTIRRYQKQIAEDEVQTLKATKSQKALILKAQLNETNSLTKSELNKVVKTTTDSLYKEVAAYNSQYGRIKQGLKNKKITQAEANVAIEALNKQHNATLTSLGISYINAEKAQGKQKKAILDDLVTNTGLTMSKAEKIYDNFAKNQRKLNSVSIDTTQNMSKQTMKLANAWNKMVLDPKTGDVKTNAVEEVAKAIKSKNKWNQIKLLKKEGKLSSNAKSVVAEALIQNGTWDKMSWADKQAWVRYKGAQEMVKAFQDSDKWKTLTLQEKQAIVKCQGATDLAEAVINYNLWNKLPEKEKQILAKDKTASREFKKAGLSLDDYNKKKVDTKDIKGNNANLLKKLSDGSVAIDTHNRKVVSTKYFNGNSGSITSASRSSVNAIGAHNRAGVNKKFFNGSASSAINASSSGRSAISRWNGHSANKKYLNVNDHASGTIHGALSKLNAWNAAKSVKHTLTTVYETIFKTKKSKHKRFGTRNFEGGPMVVNDQQGPVFRELVQLPDGQMFIPHGRNVQFNAPKGTRVLKASDTLKKFPNLPQFAQGTVDKPKFNSDMTYLRMADNVVATQSATVDMSGTNGRLDAIAAILNAMLNGTLNVELTQSQLNALKTSGTSTGNLRTVMQDMNRLTSRQIRGSLNV